MRTSSASERGRHVTGVCGDLRRMYAAARTPTHLLRLGQCDRVGRGRLQVFSARRRDGEVLADRAGRGARLRHLRQAVADALTHEWGRAGR
eukprot:3215538-Prymnesium_polylepis.2